MKTKIIIAVIIVIITVVIIVYNKPIKEMTKDIENKIISFIIKYNEGGYVNDPNDPGGETKYGISKRAFPSLDIKNLTLEQAIEIYRTKYFTKLPTILQPQLLYQVLDMAINAGPSIALKLYHNGISLDEYKAKRMAYYKSLKNFALYGNSWTTRTNRTFF